MTNKYDKNKLFIHESTYIDNDVEIGKGTKIWHLHIFVNKLKLEKVGYWTNAMIGPDVKIGNKCKIQNNVSVYNGVSLGNGVFCGPSCVFTNVLNLRAEINRKKK